MLSLDAIWLPHSQQQHFRLLLDAMARPGKCQPLPIAVESSPLLAVLATLLDAEVTLADPHRLLNAADWPMLQARSATVDQADYVVCDAQRAPDFQPKLGSLPSPEQSATLILKVDSLGGDSAGHGMRLQLSGPGIQGQQPLQVSGLNYQWLQQRADWVCSFPLGVDLILVDARQLVALPRTTRVEWN